MSARAFLGIDVGLSGMRASLVGDRGETLAQERDQVDCDRLSADDLANRVEALVLRVSRQMGALQLAAMAVCAFGPAPVLLTAEGDAVLRLGMRAVPAPCATGDDLRGRIDSSRATHPVAWTQAAICCDLTGFLVGRMTGEIVIDPETRSDFRAAGLDRLLALPSEVPATEICGGLTSIMAARLGLPPGTPVAAGCYDSSADLLAAGFGPDRPACMVIGTTLVLGRLTEAPVRDPALRSVACSTSSWFSGGWTNSAGASLDLAGRWLGDAGATGPTAATPLVLPFFSGERAPIWEAGATGAVLGLTSGMSSADLHRGFAEGVALSALDIADRLAAEIGPAAGWFASGGATRAAGLMQALADALGAPIALPDPASTSLGPAYLAARAAGVSLVLAETKVLQPRPAATERFHRRLRAYRAAQIALSPLHETLHEHTA